MARAQRTDAPGLVHHVTARGVEKRLLFLDEADYRAYQALFERTARLAAWQPLGLCLMPDHVHLLLETPQPTLSDGMQDLHGRYGRRFNDRHDRVGHLFQGRFHSELVASDRHLAATLRYVARNPVEAGLCACPREWRWSPHGAIAAGHPPAWFAYRRLQELFGRVEAYLDLVERPDA